MSAPPPVISPVRRDELSTVRRLAHEIWHRHYPGIISVEQIDYMLERGYSLAALAAFVEAPASGLALASVDGEPVGFVAYQPGAAPGETKLDKLYVLPERHGQGIGRALIEHVVAAARVAGSTTIVLNVNRNNADSIRAYQRCGFAIRSRGDFPIGGGFVMEDYIMAKPVEGPPQ
jgi:diamine N-acetyltransferase